MPPRLRLISPTLSPSTCAVRCLHTSTQKHQPRSLFPTEHLPNGKRPSKYNLLNKRSDDINDAFQWSTLKRPTNDAHAGASVTIPSQINTELNALNQLRINPVDIDPKKPVSEDEEARLLNWNRQHEALEANVRNNRNQQLQDNFAFPLAEGQLYTSYDLTFKAWEERSRVRDAIQADVPDPFKRIGVDPYWEYKNWALLSNFVSSMGRILPASRTGCSAKNQRKLSKAIRRARALGFMPIWSRHPHLKQSQKFEIQQESVGEQLFRGSNSTGFLARVQPPSAI